jgi:hypothetical protein
MPDYDAAALKRRFENLDQTLKGLGPPKDTRLEDDNYITVNRAELNDWHKCPNCGSENIENIDVERWESSVVVWDTICHDCEHEWWEVYEATHREEKT